MVQQQIERQGYASQHTHPATVHRQEHYHLSHHHRAGEEWEHGTYWHTHEHNHNELTHSHDYDREEEEQQHARDAHMHAHTLPRLSLRESARGDVLPDETRAKGR